MAETMIERVARKLAQLEIGEGETVADEFWPRYVGDARQIVAAMREPTEDMVEAGARDELGLALVKVWEDMIDAALAEEG